jgi:lipopolysaccharide transport system permease protein
MPKPTVRIEPSRALALGVTELWQYRWLLYFLVWRDLKVRYKHTALGVGWALVQPAAAMVVFATVFGRFAGLSSDGAPYPVFAYVALVPWSLFATSLTLSATSISNNTNLVKKVYFPRVVLPLSTVLSALLDFAVASVLTILLALHYGIAPTSRLAIVPLLLVLLVATALAGALWLTALGIRFPDVRHAVPFLLNVWLYATPVAYSSSLIPERWFSLYALNPMVGVVEGFRWAVLGQGRVFAALLPAAVAMLLLLASGGLVFSRLERTFSDLG